MHQKGPKITFKDNYDMRSLPVDWVTSWKMAAIGSQTVNIQAHNKQKLVYFVDSILVAFPQAAIKVEARSFCKYMER